ncbi:MAG: hypothetical protein A2252_05825 [Elusimicrobia bacterium RIFOXYA2_FULL_39_19]|nr:MAG: hypothetical protein A2252_05825 [Elusimicrobia bacterium RIFOXYA2_FULL_39_19]
MQERIILTVIILCTLVVTAAFSGENDIKIERVALPVVPKMPVYTIPFAVTPPSIEGKIDEWKNVEPIELNTSQTALNYKNWKGPEDFSAKIYMMWDYECLYVAAEVIDAAHMHKYDGEDVWNGDCVQFAFDGFNDRSKDTYKQDDVEMTMALTPKGPQLFCHYSQDESKYALVKNAKVSVVRFEKEKITRYEAAIKWDELQPLLPVLEGAAGFDTIVQNATADGTDVYGWLQWTEGIANSKATHQFGNVFFEKPAKSPAKDVVLSGINRFETVNGEDVIIRTLIFSSLLKAMDIKATITGTDGYNKTKQKTVELVNGVADTGIIWQGEKESNAGYKILLEAINSDSKEVIYKKEYSHKRNSLVPLYKDLAALKKQLKQIVSNPGMSEKAKNTATLYVEVSEEALGLYRNPDQVKKCLKEAADLFNTLLKGNDILSGARLGNYFTGYKSKYDNALMPYVVDVPEDYNKDKQYPLYIKLHGFGGDMSKFNVWFYSSNKIDTNSALGTTKKQYIKVQPFGRGNVAYHNLGEKDVFDVIEEVRKTYNIDPDRIYLNGFSMGGGGTWYLGLKYPDFWAAIVPCAGFTSSFRVYKGDMTVFAKNAVNLPVYCFHGDKDTTVSPSYSRAMVDAFKKLGYPITYEEAKGLSHETFEENDIRHLDWALKQKRNRNPKKVRYVCSTLSANKSYWVSILSKIDYAKNAVIEAEIKSAGEITVKTENIGKLLLDLPADFVKSNKKAVIIVDNAPKIEVNTESTFQIILEKTGDNKWVIVNEIYSAGNKKPGVCGPINEILDDRFIFVYGTKQNKSLLKETAENEKINITGNKWGQMFGDFEIKADNKVTEEDVLNANLILYGNPENNALIKKYMEKATVPVKFTQKGVTISGTEYSNDCIFVMPNPENPQRLVCIATVTDKNSSFVRIKNELLGDYAVYKLKPNSSPEILKTGYFNSNWK